MLGKYEDDVVCDVVPSKTRDLILGFPWKYQCQAKHDRCTNTYYFLFDNRQITLVPEEFDRDQTVKRESETKITIESLFNVEKQWGVTEKKENNRREVERKENVEKKINEGKEERKKAT